MLWRFTLFMEWQESSSAPMLHLEGKILVERMVAVCFELGIVGLPQMKSCRHHAYLIAVVR